MTSFAETIQQDPSTSSAFYQLTNQAGMQVELMALGARIGAIRVPINGRLVEANLSYSTPFDYQSEHPYLGATLGRFAYRIDEGFFQLDEILYELNQNDGYHCLHGGRNGFHSRIWHSEQLSANRLSFSLQSEDGDEGFPGTLNVQVVYELSESNELSISYRATTSLPTVVNLCNHSYFHLGSSDLNTLELSVRAFHFLPTTRKGIPTGLYQAVTGSSVDFTVPKSLLNPQKSSKHLELDHTLILAEPQLTERAAQLHNPANGLTLDIYTDQPAIRLNSARPPSHGSTPTQAISLDTTACPDAPNKPYFPTTLLRPGQGYHKTTRYHFYQKNAAS